MSDYSFGADLRHSCVEVVPGLWIGGGDAEVPERVRTVVTIEETTPPLGLPGISETRSPFLDWNFEPVPHDVVQQAVDVAAAAEGEVLIRCAYGLNRSALVVALILVAGGHRADEAVDLIRAVRPGALSNAYFVDLIHVWPGDPMPSWSAASDGPGGATASR